jgi:putative transposase
MIAFIDDHRQAYGVEPICRVLRIAPSTYHARVAQRADPAKACPRVRQDLVLMVHIRRMHDANSSPAGSSAGGCRGRRMPTSASMPSERLLEAGIEPSVGSVGDSYDDALAETVVGLVKTEVIRRRGPWRSMEAVEFATLEWVDWYNHRRFLEPAGKMAPAEAEARYYAELEALALAA